MILLGGLGAALAGCDLAPHRVMPVVSIPASYTEAASWHMAVPADRLDPGHWWTLYGDAELDGLEARLEPNSPDLAASLASFGRARAFAAEAEAGLFPQVSVGGQIQTDRQSNRRPRRGRGEPNQYLNNDIDAQAVYEIDLWHRVANEVKAGRASAEASAADLATVRLSLEAELADDFLILRGLDAQADVLARTEATYRQALVLTQNRFAGKISPEQDVSRAQTQLDDASAQVADVASRRALMQHAIATLVGLAPEQLSITPATTLLRLPLIATGLPSSLLQRRPDIASAERQMVAANATIGVARAAFYPTVSLDLVYGLVASSFNIFSLPDSFWALGPGLTMPLFEGGLRHAEESGAVEAYHLAVANYRGTVLRAFQEVEDSLSQIEWLGREARDEAGAAKAAGQTEAIATNLYKDGASSYLEVVTAQTAALQAERAVIDLRTRRLEASVALIRALGGGWTQRDLPDTKGLSVAQAGGTAPR